MNVLVLSFVAGAVFGGLHLGLLWIAVARLARGPGGVAGFLLLSLTRGALLLAAAAAAVTLGVSAAGMGAAALGFLLVRLVATGLAEPWASGAAAWR